jgi:glycerol kinase
LGPERGRPGSGQAGTGPPLRLLTMRERDVLKRMTASLSNKEIAAELGVSANTVAVHAKNIYKKLRLHSRKEVVAAAEAEARQPPQARRAAVSSRQYILALDQGTTRTRATVFDHKGMPVSFAEKQLEPSYPRVGWVEHDGSSIWSAQAGVAAEAMAAAGLNASHIAAIGIANQRETTLVWDRDTGRPVYPAIAWQDRRTSETCGRLKEAGHTEWIRAKTGLIPDSYFSATKIQWVLEHVKGARKQAEAGRLLFGTVDSWLAWNCTRGELHVTDATNASRTMLYNIHTRAWDQDLLSFFGIPAAMLPQVKSSSEVYGAAHAPFTAAGVPIAGLVGDQQAAMFGQRCTASGMVKSTYGTGCFMVMNTGAKPITSKNNLLTTIAWDLGGEVTYALEGSIFNAGAVVEWLRDGLGLIRRASDVEALAATVPDNGGVFMVPAFDGLGAPHWNPHARGTLVGLTRTSTAGHIARAALESIAYQTRDVLKAMESDSGIRISELRVDGSATSNDLLMQFQSDILKAPVCRPKAKDTTALGAAYLAGLAVGYWADPSEIEAHWREARRFQPAGKAERVRSLLQGWDRALKVAASWVR